MQPHCLTCSIIVLLFFMCRVVSFFFYIFSLGSRCIPAFYTFVLFAHFSITRSCMPNKINSITIPCHLFCSPPNMAEPTVSKLNEFFFCFVTQDEIQVHSGIIQEFQWQIQPWKWKSLSVPNCINFLKFAFCFRFRFRLHSCVRVTVRRKQ